MIIRSALQCETCGAVATVRIGMGQGVCQEHTVNCLECHEPMSFGMKVDYSALSTDVFAIEGCSIVEPRAYGSGSVINVDANFTVPQNMIDQDMIFPRLTQMQEMRKVAEGFEPTPVKKFVPSTKRRPTMDFLAEWKLLKKAISLSANGRTKLANQKVTEGTAEYYADEPLSGPTDWFFRFTLNFLGHKHGGNFRAIIDEFGKSAEEHDYSPLLKYYGENLVEERFARYREIYTDFFSKYSHFAQVLFQARLGIVPSDEMVATSVQFDQVKSFYGDAYEVFAGSVDLLAMLNNVKQGRAYDEFETLTLNKYQKLDNASKFNSFEQNAVFTALCAEKDNQLRNASHHKGIRIDAYSKTLRYRSGKGGAGPEQEMTYATYLHKSVTLLLQISVLAAFELVLCSGNNIDLPFD